ncbi:MAG: cytochrome c, partial [Deltaproteobacteria bacterium]|nr:cytochrome c [Deltaproteobacteria bacterium]
IPAVNAAGGESGSALRVLLASALLFGSAWSLSGCGTGVEGGNAESGTPADRGRRVYKVNCIVCHNADPSLPGAVGPAIKGSPRELVEARVLRAEYPSGYTPQRESKLMPAQPHLGKDIDDLAAFLAE